MSCKKISSLGMGGISIWVRYEFTPSMIFDTAINIFHDKCIR